MNKTTKNVLENIYKTGLKFLLPLTLEETYSTIVKEAVKLVKADYGSIFIEKNGAFERVYPYSSVVYKIKIRRPNFISNAFKMDKPIISNTRELSKYSNIKESGIKSIVTIPLSYQHKTIGVLTLQSYKENYFEDSDIEFLKLFGPVGSLAIQKNKAYDEAQKALEARDLFISTAAHELRTPITTIHGYTEFLYRKLGKKENKEDEVVRWVRELHTESIRLTILVKDLLEINRIKNKKSQYLWKECSLNELARRAVNNFSINYPHRQLVLKNNLKKRSDLAIGDFDKLLQVLINLLDNAVKYSSVESAVSLCLDFNWPNFIIQVKDCGEGISKKQQKKIFEKFYRGDGRLDSNGMGLGLYLVKDIIDHHRGSINIRSKVKKGTTVEIRLPIVKYSTVGI